MKSLLIIPTVIAAVIGLWAICLALAGVHIHAVDPIAAGALVILASSLGILPILIRRDSDAAETWQAALAGTVIHLLVTFAGAAILMTTGVVSWHGQFPFWLIAAYWTSLFLLTKQLRQLALKVPGKC
jgi:hypothetical protein